MINAGIPQTTKRATILGWDKVWFNSHAITDILVVQRWPSTIALLTILTKKMLLLSIYQTNKLSLQKLVKGCTYTSQTSNN
jgi:hypothetical protein